MQNAILLTSKLTNLQNNLYWTLQKISRQSILLQPYLQFCKRLLLVSWICWIW